MIFILQHIFYPEHSSLRIDISPIGENITELSINLSVTNKGYKQNYVNNNANKGRKFYFDQCRSDFMNKGKWKQSILNKCNGK